MSVREDDADDVCGVSDSVEKTCLSNDAIERYSRQLILEEGFGVQGQALLLRSSVLVVGAGGIGSTALLYLSAMGVGHVGIADHDVVEMTNLHRQVIHSADRVGVSKAESAKCAVLALNPTVRCTALKLAVESENALAVISGYDVVVDASDNPATRYTLNDACVLANKPLISGSAVGTEGQLTVYNYKNGPCYRCLYPKPRLSKDCASCADAGVLGPVPGLIGILQAMEAVKVLTGMGRPMSDKLLMYDALGCTFTRVAKPRSTACPVCSTGESVTIRSMEDSRANLIHARGPTNTPVPAAIPTDATFPDSVSCAEYKRDVLDKRIPHVLLDVRSERQYEMCALEHSVNVPLRNLMRSMQSMQSVQSTKPGNEESQKVSNTTQATSTSVEIDAIDVIESLSNGTKPVYCICRRGVASVQAASILQKLSADSGRTKIHSVYNIAGGLNAWRQQVDVDFPIY